MMDRSAALTAGRTSRILLVVVLLGAALAGGGYLLKKWMSRGPVHSTKAQHERMVRALAMPRIDWSVMADHPARSADSFVGFIGVNGTTANPKEYPDYIERTFIPAMQELGIRRLRTDIPSDPSPGFIQNRNLISMYNRAGIRAILTLKLNAGKDHKFSTSPLTAAQSVSGLGKVVEAIEAPNEYDNERFRPEVNDFDRWTGDLRKYTNEVRDTFRGSLDPAVKATPLIGPSFVGVNRIGGLRRMDVGTYDKNRVDFGNIHTYEFPYDTQVKKRKGRDNYERIEKHVYQREIYRAFSNSEQYVTEFGCATPLDNKEGKGVTELEQSKYLPRQLLDLFNRGYRAAYIFEMRDSGKSPDYMENNYGLLRNNNEKKPSFNALKNLLNALAEPKVSPSFAPSALKFHLAGKTADIQTTLLQKSDGTFYLLIWADLDSSLPSAPIPISLELDHKASSVSVYDPLRGASVSTAVTGGKSVSLAVPDSPLVVTIKP